MRSTTFPTHAATPAARLILDRLQYEIFDRAIIGNVARGLFVEAMIASLLEPDWVWVGKDWASWDFEHPSTWKTIEIKQSAALQPWSNQGRKAKPRFDIALRTGYWYQAGEDDPIEWVAEECRPADMYVFAWHGVDKPCFADQRDPAQWTFYLLVSEKLPPSKTVGLKWLYANATMCAHSDLKEKVATVAASANARQRCA